MKWLPSGLIAMALGAALSVSCSVKEDREDCPRCLMLDFGEVDSEQWPSLEISVTGPDGFRFTDSVTAEDFGEYVIEIPKTEIYVNVYSVSENYYSPEGLVIPPGSDCPAFYLHNHHLFTKGELMVDTVRLHKDWCLLSMTMTTDSKPLSFSFEIDGNVCGYGLDGAPSSGEFTVNVQPGEKGYCSFGLPRQVDGSLVLKIEDDGTPVREFAIGEYITESGYDWSAEDLEDIQLEIDFSRTVINFSIGKWKQTVRFDIDI